MTTHDADDPVDLLLRRRGITDDALRTMDLEEGFDDLLAGLDRRRPRSRHRLRLVAGGAVTATVLAAGGIAAAGGHDALTGVFGKPGSTENDTSEYVDVTAPDFPDLVRRQARELDAHGLVWAPGVVEQQQVQLAIRQMSQTRGLVPARPVLMQVTGVQGGLAERSLCGWQTAWLRAHDAGDRAGRQAALTGWQRVAGLPVVARVNDRHWQLETIGQAQHGDLTRLRFLVARCSAAQP